MEDQACSTLPSTRRISLRPWVFCIIIGAVYFYFYKFLDLLKWTFKTHFFHYRKIDCKPPRPRDGIPLSARNVLWDPSAEAQNCQDQGEGGPGCSAGGSASVMLSVLFRIYSLVVYFKWNAMCIFEGIENPGWFRRQGLPPPNLHQTCAGQTNPFPGGHPTEQPLCECQRPIRPFAFTYLLVGIYSLTVLFLPSITS